MKRIKRITSHAGHAQFLFDCAQDGDDCKILGYIPRHPEIPSPYAYSPDHEVYQYNGQPVIVVETMHKRYDVFLVTEPLMAESL